VAADQVGRLATCDAGHPTEGDPMKAAHRRARLLPTTLLAAALGLGLVACEADDPPATDAPNVEEQPPPGDPVDGATPGADVTE
jgi:hypothetical protein